MTKTNSVSQVFFSARRWLEKAKYIIWKRRSLVRHFRTNCYVEEFCPSHYPHLKVLVPLEVLVDVGGAVDWGAVYVRDDVA